MLTANSSKWRVRDWNDLGGGQDTLRDLSVKTGSTAHDSTTYRILATHASWSGHV